MFTYLKLVDSLIAQAALTPSSEDPAYPIANLKVEPVSKVWRTVEGQTADQSIQIDFSFEQTADIIALVNHNFTSDATITLNGGSTPAPNGSQFQTVISPQGRTARRIFVEQTWRYWLLLIDDPTNGDGYLETGLLPFGVKTALTRGFQYGFSRRRETINQVLETEYGVIDVGANLTQRTRFIASWKTGSHAERDELDSFLLGLERERKGLLFIPDPDAPESFYGRFLLDYALTQTSPDITEISGLEFLEDSPGRSLRVPLFIAGDVDAWNAGDALTFFARASVAYYKNASLQLVSAPVDTPRIHFAAAGVSGLLIESASENKFLHSEALDNAAWNKIQSSISADAETAPDLTSTADKIVEDTNSGAHEIAATFPETPTDDTWQALSLFAKAGERTSFDFMCTTKAGMFSYGMVDLTDGSTTIFAGDIILKTEQYVNGWWRVLCAYDVKSGGTGPGIELRMRDGSGQSYTGDGSSGLYMWGLQWEKDQPWPTSYMPSGAAAGTRAAEVAWLTAPLNPQAISVYVRSIELGQQHNADEVALALIGDDPGAHVRVAQAADDAAAHDNGSTEESATLASSRELGDLVEYIAQIRGDGAVKLIRRTDGSTIDSSSFSSSNPLPGAWGAPGPLRLGFQVGTVAAPVLLQRVKIVRGLVSDFAALE
jgi:hypothetical protein